MEVIFLCGSVQLPIVDAHLMSGDSSRRDELVFIILHHSDSALFWYDMHMANLVAIRNWVNNPCV